MESRVDQAIERHKRGFNCAQAVACTYCDLAGVSEDVMFRMMEGFGAGMGAMECTCGAVSGAVAVAGMKNSNGRDLANSKGKTYQLSRKITSEFREKNGSTVCKDLKGVETKQVLRSCDGCIADAAELVEKILFTQE